MLDNWCINESKWGCDNSEKKIKNSVKHIFAISSGKFDVVIFSQFIYKNIVMFS